MGKYTEVYKILDSIQNEYCSCEGSGWSDDYIKCDSCNIIEAIADALHNLESAKTVPQQPKGEIFKEIRDATNSMQDKPTMEGGHNIEKLVHKLFE